jgi:uncharacterized tellurite resistance protein B-like protein
MASEREEVQGQLTEIDEGERVAMLELLVWVAMCDEEYHDEEAEMVAGMAETLGLADYDIDTLVDEAEGRADVEEAAAAVESTWAKKFVLGYLVRMAWADGRYRADERAGLLRVCKGLGLDPDFLSATESLIVRALAQQVDHDAIGEAADQQDGGRFWKVAAGTALGAVAVGVTGGLAAPAVGGAVGSLLGYSGAAATSAGLAALGGGSLAAGGAGMAGGTAVVTAAAGLAGGETARRAMSKRTKKVDDLEVIDIDDAGVPVVVGVSGFLSEDADFESDWSILPEWAPMADVKALRWEAKANRDLYKSVAAAGAKLAGKKGLEYFGRRAMVGAGRVLSWPAWALSAISVIGNPWSVARDRAEQVGAVLAEAITNEQWGPRPVTLVGFSLGSRVIATALKKLDADELRCSVENVVLLGGAVGADECEWEKIAHAVPGAFVNGYSENDWVLGALYRVAELGEHPLGLRAVDAESVTNIDLTEIAGGHLSYREAMSEVFSEIEVASLAGDLSDPDVGVCADGSPCKLCMKREGYCHHHRSE